jgi:hypothetical protein
MNENEQKSKTMRVKRGEDNGDKKNFGRSSKKEGGSRKESPKQMKSQIKQPPNQTKKRKRGGNEEHEKCEGEVEGEGEKKVEKKQEQKSPSQEKQKFILFVGTFSMLYHTHHTHITTQHTLFS